MTARSLSATRRPVIIAKSAWFFAAKLATASRPRDASRRSPRSVSTEVKNQSGARSSSAIAVIGRGAMPWVPSMSVRSSLRCFQKRASSSRVSVMAFVPSIGNGWF